MMSLAAKRFPSILNPMSCMIRGNSTAKGADNRGTISGVRFNPIRMNDIPIRIITSGAERALTPNEDLSGHNLASLLGRDANQVFQTATKP